MPTKDTHIIDVKTRGAKKSQKEIKGVGTALGGMAKKAGIAALAYFGARGLINAFKSSLSLYAEQQLAEVKLESALGKTSATLKKYASALQQTTRFGDEVILQGMAQLAFFIKDEKQLKIATKATLDLASAKGMDLVTAADLVAKSVGSTTNALVRYGVAAEGAVGSDERLLSITDNLAKLFGGQAEATTESYQGALDQLSNSFGDMQERIGQALAPTIRDLAVTFNDLLAIPVSEQLQEEHDNFVNLTNALLDSNTSVTTRKRIITELQTLYPEYIGNLDLEKASMEDIKDMTEDANQAMKDKIVTQIFAEQLADINQRMSKETARLFELETKGAHEASGKWRDLIDIWNFASSENQNLQDILEPAQLNRIEGLQAELAELEKNREEFELWLQSRLDGEASLDGGDGGDKLTAQEEWNEARLAEYEALVLLNEEKEKEKELMDSFIATHEKEAKVLGLTDKAKDKSNKKSLLDMDKLAAGSKKFADVQKGLAIKSTLSDTYASAQTQFKKFSESYPAPLGQILGVAAAGAAIAMGLKNVQSVKEAQYGADFVTSGPQMMMVGEGAGPERVQVTPLVDENLEGPQGGGITLNISGNVLTEEFTEDVLIPQIKEGLRLGNDMGV